MREIIVSASKNYTVRVEAGLLPKAGEMIAEACGGDLAAIVTDDTVDKLYGDPVERSLRESGYATTRFVFPHGERSKSMDTYVSLLNALAGAGMTRSDVVVALGGGVVGDLAGFAAATYLRGVPFAQIPTTLLAMVDSSVGGKTAVDLAAGKNQAGAFYQPDVVICDIDALGTLPNEVFTDGCAEMIKHGVILSADLFETLKAPIGHIMEDVVARNITIKRDIVAQDERDSGVRQLLNFGHTIGHGVEKHSGYGMGHGKAVAIGMSVVSRGASRMGICGEDCHLEIVEMLRRYGLPSETAISPELLFEAATHDKKRSGGSVGLILPERIGKCARRSFTMGELDEFIRLGTRA